MDIPQVMYTLTFLTLNSRNAFLNWRVTRLVCKVGEELIDLSCTLTVCCCECHYHTMWRNRLSAYLNRIMRYTPPNTWCYNNVIITSKRCHYCVMCLLGPWRLSLRLPSWYVPIRVISSTQLQIWHDELTNLHRSQKLHNWSSSFMQKHDVWQRWIMNWFSVDDKGVRPHQIPIV